MTAQIRIGTSGYSFKDWVGTVYPAGLQPRDFLSYYAQTFDTVEINSTYYRVPAPSMFVSMLRKVPADFVFVVKLPGEMTHRRDRFDGVKGRFLACIQPLLDAGQLGGLLAQFPYRFKNNPDSLGHLQRIADLFVSRDIPTNIELRNRGWCQREVYERLRDVGLGFVNVDLPRLSGLPLPSQIATSDTGYFRLHGRNDKAWWATFPKGKEGLRYDYLYSDEEIREWVPRIRDVASRTRRCYVYGNNCHLGSSYVAARQFKRFLALPDTEPPSFPETELFGIPSGDPLDAIKQRVIAAREAERPVTRKLLRQHPEERTLDDNER
jgi:uncharacterized protein YecE (DUF72 family)